MNRSLKKNKTETLTARVPEQIMDEIDSMANAMLSNRSKIISELLRYGFEGFKKDRPDICKIVESYKCSHQLEKKRA